MKSVGEAMAIGRTFKEAFLKAFRSLELGKSGQLLGQLTGGSAEQEDQASLQQALGIPTDRRMWAVFRALERGWAVEEIHRLTHIDRWFLTQFQQIVELGKSAAAVGARDLSDDLLRELKRAGFADSDLARLLGLDEASLRVRRQDAALVPAYKRIDTCAAEFESFTPYLYGTFETECEADPTPRAKVVILGSGPNRIGQGIEFDYCCCHAAFALRDEGYETVMVNCNPETVSTDYDTVDRLYFEPLTFEDVLRDRRARADRGRRRRLRRAVRRADPAQARAVAAGRRRADSRHVAGLDRSRRRPEAVRQAAVGPRDPAGAERHRDVGRRGARGGGGDRVPGRRAAVLRARRPRDGDRLRHGRARSLHAPRGAGLARTSDSGRQVPRGRDRDRRRRASPTPAAPSSSAASWSTSSRPASTPATAPAWFRRSS